MKAVFDKLDKIEGGAEIIAEIKKEMEAFRDLDAKSRIAEKEIRRLTAESVKFDELKKKIEESGIDLDNIGEMTAAVGQKSEMETTVKKLTKQLETLQKTVEQERSEKERIFTQSRVDKLKSDFGSELSQVFGKFGGVLADNLVAKGSLKYDDAGAIVYETDKGIYTKSEAVDILKKEFSEHIVPANRGSGIPAPTAVGRGVPGTNQAGQDMAKMSTRELFMAGLKQE